MANDILKFSFDDLGKIFKIPDNFEGIIHSNILYIFDESNENNIEKVYLHDLCLRSKGQCKNRDVE